MKVPATATLVADTWTKLFDAITDGIEKPKGYEITHHNNVSDPVFFQVKPTHFDGATAGTAPAGTAGRLLPAGESRDMFELTDNGAGAISEVWARSAGAVTITHGICCG